MNFFVRGPTQVIENENATDIPNEIYNLLISLEPVNAAFAGIKDSLSDAGRLY